MIGSGLCHGPGCTRVQTVPYWCSERCQLNWDRQVAGLAPVKPWPTSGYASPITHAGGFLIPAVERARPEIQPPREVTYSGTASSVMADILRVYERVSAAPPPGPFKVTRDQWQALRSANAPETAWAVGGPVAYGVPVVMVDTEEESTPHLLTQQKRPPGVPEGVGPQLLTEAWSRESTSGAKFPQVAPEDPQVGFLSRWFRRVFGRTT